MRGGQDLENLNELLTAAEVTGAALHVVHLNSSAKDDAPSTWRPSRRPATAAST
jgi:hypothetical protein